ncbi:hypothetical protein [Clostridium butyricum]
MLTIVTITATILVCATITALEENRNIQRNINKLEFKIDNLMDRLDYIKNEVKELKKNMDK